jgi:predicted phosphate transport protein (TIGR00153 family)
MAFRFVPREESFFDLFVQSAALLVQGAEVLVRATDGLEALAEHAKRLERLEHDADQLTHELMEKLNRTFITPLDREDIHQLVTEMDDVMDLMESATERFVLFKIEQIMPHAKEIAVVIQQQVQEIQRAVGELRRMHRDAIMPHCVEINRLENVGDRLLRTAFAALFDGTYEPLIVIKWRELYQLMEEATDKCEDVANTIEGIVLKNA